jgi:hypothetical protein
MTTFFYVFFVNTHNTAYYFFTELEFIGQSKSYPYIIVNNKAPPKRMLFSLYMSLCSWVLTYFDLYQVEEDLSQHYISFPKYP